ncbi:MAG: serpin family protein [Gomphosphaeria aponina SAG 52.96 = DSM 107014]|uniref:Serpin family protein n=1 Tax=Gomphosphaeria aponina SAG 52.96 = DSM 107014 TaxID=1521640 RepID=A0A941GWJ7_9CHRO|nr:serpin family protein [Gomphosphaeria aponina SAG 52.96 = DSM 107014]
MNKKTITTLLLILGSFLMQHQMNAFPLPLTADFPSIIAQSKMNQNLITANTQFGFKLLQTLMQEEEQQNIFISPTSIAYALAMAYNGANGETQQEIATALGLQAMSLAEINSAFQLWQENLANIDPKVQLDLANSLWLREGFSFLPQFLENNESFYNAQIETLDFTNPDSPRIINGWVKENTGGKIEEIVDNLHPDDVLFLINAIYFQGSWTQEFNQELTVEKPFYLADGGTKQLPMMSQEGYFSYYENEQFQAVSLPYGAGRLSMYIFLPREDSNLATFLGELTAENWEQWLAEFTQQKGSVTIPRFQLEYDITLNSVLQSLGLERMFDSEKADFSNMTPNPVYVNQIKHKTFVEVNEEGTEAAAVTSIGIRAMSALPTEESFHIIVDRPFFFAIRDHQTGTVLFMGSLIEPKE